jgi:hypothetical protein
MLDLILPSLAAAWCVGLVASKASRTYLAFPHLERLIHTQDLHAAQQMIVLH